MMVNRRILIGKAGLDGHDRGAKYIAQVLRDAGFEVIYTGIRRTPEQIVNAAIQEDVAAIGLSLLSGAHMELFGRIIGLVREAKVTDLLLFGGGVIPNEDAEALKRQGVAEVFTPGTSAASIVETIERHLQTRPTAVANVGDLFRDNLPAKIHAAARLMTQLENDPSSFSQVLRDYASTGRPAPRARMVLGVTGAPGSGKSTLTGALVQAFRRRHPGERVGVIAVDPTSSITHGALLGDRVRMMHLSDDPLVFVRSLATRGHLGGLSSGARGVMRAMELLGCGVIFVETVGVGQNEAEISTLADLTALVMAPGQGDDIQMLKAGVLEIADAIIINKGDQPDAQLLFEQVSAAQQMRREVTPGKPVHIALCSAVNGSGVEALADHLDRAAQEHTAAWQARRS